MNVDFLNEDSISTLVLSSSTLKKFFFLFRCTIAPLILKVDKFSVKLHLANSFLDFTTRT